MEEKQNILLKQEQEQQQHQQQRNQQGDVAHAKGVPQVCFFSVAQRLLREGSLATLHRKPLQGFLSLLETLAIEVMELTPAQAVARVLEATGLAAAVKEDQRKKREKAAEAAAEAVVQTEGYEEGHSRDTGSVQGVRKQHRLGTGSAAPGASRQQQQQEQQSSRKASAAGSDDESEGSSEDISDSEEEDSDEEVTAREKATLSQVGECASDHCMNSNFAMTMLLTNPPFLACSSLCSLGRIP
jgi:superfamily I DNA/RNA helicase